MESPDFNVVSIQDTILAGMYSNGYTDLETVNKDLFVSVNSWSKLFAKIDSNDDNIIKTLLISLSQSLINFEKKVLYICKDEESANSTNEKFTNILKFVESVNSGVNNLEARLIFTTFDTFKEYQDIGYVIIDNSLSSELVEKLNFSVNYAVFIQNDLNSEITELVKKLNSIETEVFIPQAVENNEGQLVEEQVVEEQVVEEQVVEEQVVEEQVVEDENNEEDDVEQDENNEEEDIENNKEEVVENNEEQVVDNNEDEDESDSSEDSLDLQEVLKNLNLNFENPEEVYKKKKLEMERKKNRNLLLKLASKRR